MDKKNVSCETGDSSPAHSHVPKLCGADIELANFFLGSNKQASNRDAAMAILSEIDGLPRVRRWRGDICECSECRKKRQQVGVKKIDRREAYTPSNYSTDAINRDRSVQGSYAPAGRSNYAYSTGSRYGINGGSSYPSLGYTTSSAFYSSNDYCNPMDYGRKFLPSNGGCVYIDLDHLELCIPEVISAYDHVACWHAMLRIARDALHSANEKQSKNQRIQVMVNNTDGKGNSFGSHTNFCITRRCWDNIFNRKLQYLLYLAAFQVSSIVLTGQGKVGSENRSPSVEYQISQRADFMEALTGTQTTYHRGIVNSRDESLCGRPYGASVNSSVPEDLARLHVIFFDNTLCHVSSLLKIGMMQIIMTMLEAERVNLDLTLDDPVEALINWSHDPGLRAVARTTKGIELKTGDRSYFKKTVALSNLFKHTRAETEEIFRNEEALEKLVQKLSPKSTSESNCANENKTLQKGYMMLSDTAHRIASFAGIGSEPDNYGKGEKEDEIT